MLTFLPTSAASPPRTVSRTGRAPALRTQWTKPPLSWTDAHSVHWQAKTPEERASQHNQRQAQSTDLHIVGDGVEAAAQHILQLDTKGAVHVRRAGPRALLVLDAAVIRALACRAA